MKKPLIAIVNSSSFGKHFPQHLEQLQEIGDLIRVDVQTKIEPRSLVQKLQGVNAVIASVTPQFASQVLLQLDDLVLLARHGIGCDNVDLDAATSLGIMVSKVQGEVEREALAEHTVALLLGAGRQLHRGYTSVRENRWQDRANYLGIELGKKRIGLIGIGNIGSRVAEILSRGFNAEVCACDPQLSAEEIRKRCAEPLPLEELLATSDVISFHCPLNSNTRRMLSREKFAMLKRGALLVNTCRGELVDEDALIDALKSGRLRGYATDVVEGEPIDGSHRLLLQPNALVVPHLGGYTEESLFGMGQTMVDDVANVFVNGTRPGVLANPKVLEKEHRVWA